MIKEALTTFFTLVSADQITRIEIHDAATEFFTDFEEDLGCSAWRVGCGGISEGWEIASVPSGTPAWRYSTALEDPECWGFYTAQSPIE